MYWRRLDKFVKYSSVLSNLDEFVCCDRIYHYCYCYRRRSTTKWTIKHIGKLPTNMRFQRIVNRNWNNIIADMHFKLWLCKLNVDTVCGSEIEPPWYLYKRAQFFFCTLYMCRNLFWKCYWGNVWLSMKITVCHNQIASNLYYMVYFKLLLIWLWHPVFERFKLNFCVSIALLRSQAIFAPNEYWDKIISTFASGGDLH